MKTFILSLQHVLAMYAGAVIVPIIVAGGLGLSAEQTTYLVSVDIFMCGVATFLQVYKGKFTGIGLPVVLGCTFTAVAPMIAIGNSSGLPTMYGAIFVSGLVVVGIAPFFAKVAKLFPPVVTGSVVTIIGITLVPVAMNYIAGGQGSKDFGNPKNIILACITLAIILVIYKFTTGFIQSIAILLGLVSGTVIASFMGMVSLTEVTQAGWFQHPTPLKFASFEFNISAILTFVIVGIVSMIESTGVYYALGNICNQEVKEPDLRRGYLAEGLAVMIGSLVNAFPYTTYSQNVGLVQISGVKSKKVMYVMVLLLLVFGSIPKIGALATIVPQPVLGGAMISMFGMVLAYGVKMLGNTDFAKQENLMIIACSVGLGLGVTTVPTAFAQLPSFIRMFTDSGIVLGTIVAIVMNLIFNRKSKLKNN